MASSIDPTLPVTGNATTLSVRTNFAAAKAEIESIQSQLENVSSDWGTITGTLSDQTDLQNALDAKSNTDHNHDLVYATPNDIDQAIADLVDTAPATLDTLNELSFALGDDPNFATTVTNQIAAKADADHNHDGTYEPADANIAKVNAVQTFTVAQTINNLTVGKFQETHSTLSSGVIDLAQGNMFAIALTGDITFSIQNASGSPSITNSFLMEITDGGLYTVTWWSGIKWPEGLEPELTLGGTDVLSFYTIDGGTTWRGFLSAKDMK